MDLIGRGLCLNDQLQEDAISDADSDELELRLENARFEQSVQAFLASYRDPDEDEPSSRTKRGKSTAGRHSRTNRKELEPRADIKLRLAEVNRTFLNGDYPEAERRIHEIIRINAETDTGAAEDCFLLTIQVDDSNIDARIELAKIYEDAREDEEALILVTEAIALQGAEEHAYRAVRGKTDVYSADAHASTKNRKRPHGHNPAPGSVVRPRYRPKRLVAPDQRRREERDRADELSRRHKEVRDLKRGIQEGNRGLIPIWMAAAKDLVDDFRSFRKFYTWDKYVKYLGASEGIVFNAPIETQYSTGTSELHELAERLSRNVAPSQGDDGRVHVPSDDDGHRGIPFGEWLELFLDFAISLALEGHGHEAYQVCEAARDSIVFVNSKDFMFLIHVAWAACAIYLGDEEMCVAMARFFTKVQQLDSDSYRMFAALCRLCQSPASWYNSGPVQKYILRQIRLIDATQLRSTQPGTQVTIPVDNSTAQGQTRNLDVCLLTLYGHILFTSTSYTYALNYFLRARSLDPINPMINLSVGLGYIHHGLKRQSENRQYLIMQGLACLFEYADCRMNGSNSQRHEALFTVARSFHMLGLHHLAHCWYQRVIDDQSLHPGVAPGDRDTIINAAFNQYIILITSEENTILEASLLYRLVL
ncbi:hypothetical protein BN1723_008034 [Verticillium longisporum]|uniref:Uncharacterized protein n=1 Tax=Verticillium longisporum TaxID=100787 RepID=A0A0G4NPZ9_VERLO|nr:hypothetical protein BN1723_008034 [Verticillium longisporum]